MPLKIPSVTSEDVWSYVTRVLTDPDSYKADVSGLQTEADASTRAIAFLAAIGAIPTTPELEASASTRSIAFLAAIGAIPTNTVLTAHFDLAEFEKVQAPAAENAVVAVAVTTADQSLGSKDITVDIPAGGTIISVLAVAKINIMNDAATAQKIDLKFEVESVALFNQSDVVGFGAIDGASAVFLIAEDASDEVTADEQVVTLEAKATLSAAASVRFQAQYYLFIAYKMG